MLSVTSGSGALAAVEAAPARNIWARAAFRTPPTRRASLPFAPCRWESRPRPRLGRMAIEGLFTAGNLALLLDAEVVNAGEERGLSLPPGRVRSCLCPRAGWQFISAPGQGGLALEFRARAPAPPRAAGSIPAPGQVDSDRS